MEHCADNLFVIGISHECASPETLGANSLTAENCTIVERGMLERDEVSEAVILSTCNRIEIYFVSRSRKPLQDILEALQDIGRDVTAFCNVSYARQNAEALQHLFEVASGLKSQMTGETEILGQVKAAYARAAAAGHCRGVLNTAFQKAAHYAKWVRSNTEIGRGKISLGSVSSELAARIFEDISRAKILLLGSGEAGRLIADALYVRGARDIVVASRTRANAETLAEKVCGRAENLSEAIQKLSAYDIILSASFSDEPLIVYNAVNEAMQKRRNRPMFLIDLAIPRNIEEKCAQIEDVYIYNLSDLSKIANENMEARRAEIESSRKYIKEKARAIGERLFAPRHTHA